MSDDSNAAYGLKIKVVNNLLLARILELAATVNEFCRDNGLNNSLIGELVNMKSPAVRASGEWRPVVLSLAEILGCLPEELFTEEQMRARLETNAAYVTITQREGSLLAEASTPQELTARRELVLHLISKADLSEREQEVLRLRLNDWTLNEIAQKFLVSRARAQQFEAKALWKLNRVGRREDPEQERLEDFEHRTRLKRRAGMDTLEDDALIRSWRGRKYAS
jgi:hypothetical protein